jgi:hypothetical protein
MNDMISQVTRTGIRQAADEERQNSGKSKTRSTPSGSNSGFSIFTARFSSLQNGPGPVQCP